VKRRPSATDASGEGAAPTLDFVSHIENGVRGLLGFFGGAALILWRFVASPRGFDRDADASGRLSPDVPPYTFLTLSTFLATSGFSALLTLLMLIWYEFVRESDHQAEEMPDTPSWSELLRLPSVEDVITRGIPCVLLVMAVLGLVAWVLRRRSPEAAGRFFKVGLYIAGFQYLLATAALGLFVLGWLAPGGSLLARARVADIGVLLLPFIGAWPALLYALQLDKAWSIDARASRRWRLARALAIAVLALLVSVATFAPELVVSWAMASSAVARQAQPRPLMDAAVAAFEHVDGAVPVDRVTVLVTGRARRALHLVRGQAWLRRGFAADDRSTPARIVAWQGGSADVLTIEPGRDAWIVLEAPSCPDTTRPDCGLKFGPAPPSTRTPPATDDGPTPLQTFERWTLVDTHHPTPPLASGQVGFVEAQATGERGIVFAWLRGRLRP
jgi:hypothetical protein